jgi:tRNA modification GTPase
MNDSRDTIAAISSAVGPAARMIVRVSGIGAVSLANRIFCDCSSMPSAAYRASMEFSGLEVPATIYVFRAPHSYTGEDLVEFHIPGNPLLARMLLDTLIASGARLADPGEFTARAYFNGKIDLAKAEGVAATISAHSEQELRAARQLMSGELARRLKPARDLLLETLALVEVGIDFSDEDVSFLSSSQLRHRV